MADSDCGRSTSLSRLSSRQDDEKLAKNKIFMLFFPALEEKLS